MVAILPHLTRVIAGITVPNTPLINTSIALAQAHLPTQGFNHVMRSWLNGHAIINHLPAPEKAKIDLEAFAVSAVLHDMGWALNSTFISPTKIFEVDGANFAHDLLRNQTSRKWDQHRLQLVWDTIALHTNFDIAPYKQKEVAIMSAGTLTELVGIEAAKLTYGDIVTVTQDEWEAIAAEFPRPGLKSYLWDTFIDLCTMKPAATYSNFVGDWGEEYVEGYTKMGHRPMDLLNTYLESD